MKLAAVYIAWFDGIEILPFSIATIQDHVDEVIIVYSNTSNFGKTIHYQDQIDGLGTLINWEPDLFKPAAINETEKRNFALRAVKAMNFTHFVMMDCDECYDSDEFVAAKNFVRSKDVAGLVCKIKVYIREPVLQCSDHTLVPFIHKVTRDLKFELNNKTYPFAYDEVGAHIDPTRRLNIKEGVKMSEATMHHYSHVRRDIHQKMNNSTARSNLTKSTLLEDYENAKPGYYSKFYRDTVIQTVNRFGIQI